MAENWRQKTIEVQPAIDALIKKYTSDGIDEITTREEGYMIAQATLALALNDGLNATGGTRRKKRRAAGPLFDKLLNSVAVIYMLGYDQGYKQGQQDRTEELRDLPDSSMGRFPEEGKRAK